MKKRQIISIFPLLIIVIFLAFASSCEKDDTTIDNNDPSKNLTNGETTAEFNPDIIYGTMTDLDGNDYKTVTIGTQTWMAENLRTTTYNDGSTIPYVTSDNRWENLTTGAYCNYKNTASVDTIVTHGRLYNWYAVNTGKLAPTGWHVPTDAEWTILIDYLGGSSESAGGKLKEKGTTHWFNPNEGATNETGFTALPSGFRIIKGEFQDMRSTGHWWSATEAYEVGAWVRFMYNFNSKIYGGTYGTKTVGLSVRCIRD